MRPPPSLCPTQEWLSRATNWSKFSATAGLGVIHRGHLQQGRSLMAPYLPHSLLSAAGGAGGGAAGAWGAGAAGGAGAGGGGGGGSPFSEGGALYALGLIYAGHGESIKQFLLESLRNTSNEVGRGKGGMGGGCWLALWLADYKGWAGRLKTPAMAAVTFCRNAIFGR